MKRLAGKWMAAAVLGLFFSSAALAQDAPARSPQDLDTLVAPLALYPDPLVAEIMAAATFPDQIVLADRYIAQGMSADDVTQQGLDSSVSDLAHYPNLLKWLDDNLQWTTQLGQAFATQQSDVMDAVQRMRAQAQNLGNLQSTPQETVVNDGGDIEIEPANPDEIYIPDYNPDAIYYSPGIYCSFGVGLPIGFWLGHDWDWHNHHIFAWTHNHPRPTDWWTRPPEGRHNIGGARVWNPATHYNTYHGDRGYAQTYGAGHAARPQAYGSRAVVPDSHAVAPRSTIAPPPSRTFVTPAAPADRNFRTPEAPPERSVSRAEPPPERSFSGGAFGNSENARATEAFSARGAESRGVSTPVSGGGGSRGGGGGGGGGGSHGGGGGGNRGH